MNGGITVGIEIVKGDITLMEVDAIVNAAKPSLMGGGGVDGAIHRAAGPGLIKECKTIKGSPNRCNPGEARITRGYNLKAEYVIHTVGPVYRGGNSKEAETLKNAYRNSLDLASKHSIKTVAFPSISTGVYGYPKEEAAKIAIDTIIEFLSHDDSIEKVICVTYSQADYELYKEVYSRRIQK